MMVKTNYGLGLHSHCNPIPKIYEQFGLIKIIITSLLLVVYPFLLRSDNYVLSEQSKSDLIYQLLAEVNISVDRLDDFYSIEVNRMRKRRSQHSNTKFLDLENFCVQLLSDPNFETLSRDNKLNILNKLGTTFRQSGDVIKAVECFGLVSEIIKYDDSKIGLKGYNQLELGKIAFEDQKFHESMRCFHNAYTNIGSMSNSEYDRLQSIYYYGLNALMLQEYEILLTVYREMLEEEINSNWAMFLSKLNASILNNFGKTELAIDAFEQAFDLHIKYHQADQFDELINTCVSLTSLYLGKGEIDSAILLLTEMFRLKTGEHIDAFSIETIAIDNEIFEVLILYLELAVNNPDVFSKTEIIDLFNKIQYAYKYIRLLELSDATKVIGLKPYIELMNQAIAYFYHEDSHEQIFDVMESNKSLMLLEAIDKQGYLQSKSLSKSIQSKESLLKEELVKQKRVLQDQSSNRSHAENIDLVSLKYNLFKLESQYSSFVDSISGAVASVRSFADFELRNSLLALQEYLSREDLLIEYYFTDSILYQMNLSSDTIIFREISNLSVLRKNIDQLMSGLRMDFKLIEPLAKDLYRHLIPSDLLEQNNFKRIIVVPDGCLLKLPFEILISSDSKYFLEDFQISYQYSSSILIEKAKKEIVDANMSFAGYSFSNSKTYLTDKRRCDDGFINELICSQLELEAISNILDIEKQSLFSTKSQFVNHGAGNEIIHLSTHACVDENDPNRSKIYFEDDYLTALEIQALNIDADLIVLSACDTGTGLISQTEGVMSLSKSFFLSGCQSTLTSLWPVDDCSTKEIMTRFYKHLKSGMQKSEALRHSKLDFIDNAHPERRDPFFWAGFVLIGNDAPLFEAEEAKNEWLNLIFLIMIGLLAILRFRYL